MRGQKTGFQKRAVYLSAKIKMMRSVRSFKTIPILLIYFLSIPVRTQVCNKGNLQHFLTIEYSYGLMVKYVPCLMWHLFSAMKYVRLSTLSIYVYVFDYIKWKQRLSSLKPLCYFFRIKSSSEIIISTNSIFSVNYCLDILLKIAAESQKHFSICASQNIGEVCL